ncbi:SIR2 family protein [Clostridium estertheticum]|uniref:SIR2 family protein n=1 Tax=Clostridium estertheticum TaxID=238834 RepID=UPI001CF56D01|nr:SIR2 family protein [Clostridium estertheticum]MCB2353143.1 SIR2 family protein [Clostridium estertheticum]WAG41499.1 SIR2 family protein [Clostridium estertheticum]
MKLDPLLSLACSMEAKKGIYALLLGSGISRSSGIPTGWEVTLDLIKKIAVVSGEGEVDNPLDWYVEKFGQQPDYSAILDELAKTPSERNQLLKGYFEIDNNSDEYDKKPSKAHIAIAKMIKDGYIRVVITTNFDRLLEAALADIGIIPNVISNIDQLQGAMPLIHTSCTILKVHGDYMDTRIKNTNKELSEYDQDMNFFINRILDEFGLIICGWSGEWDTALKKCISSCKNNRFSTYWLKRGILGGEAQGLIDFKRAEVIDIQGADSFFFELQEKLVALNDLSMRELPLSINLACATLKRLLPDSRNIIRINDMIMDECKNIVNKIEKLDWALTPDGPTTKQKIEQIEDLCEKLVNMTVLGCYWGAVDVDFVWVNMFKALNQIKCPSTYTAWQNICKYPAFLIMNAILMACIHSERYSLLYKILNGVKTREYSRYDEAIEASQNLYAEEVIERKLCNNAIFTDNKYVPLSERAIETLRKPIGKIVYNEDDYTNLFDKAEYFYSVNYWYNRAEIIDGNKCYEKSWAPAGRFGYKMHRFWKMESIFYDEIKQRESWAAISAGFFDKSFEVFLKCSGNLNTMVTNSAYYF